MREAAACSFRSISAFVDCYCMEEQGVWHNRQAVDSSIESSIIVRG